MHATFQGWIPRLSPDLQLRHEIDINLMLTNGLMSKYGWADTRVRDSAEHGLLLTKNSDNLQQTVPMLWVLAFYHHVASHRKTVRTLSDQLFALCEKSGEHGLLVACHTMRGAASMIDGDMAAAASSCEQVVRDYDPALYANHGYWFGLDTRVWSQASLSNVCWLCDPDSAPAFAHAQQAVAYARTLNHLPSLGIALLHLALLHQFSADADGVREVSREMLMLAQKYGLPVVEAYAETLHSWASRDAVRLERALARLKHAGCMLRHSYFTSLAAGLDFQAGNTAAALTRLDHSLQLCAQLGEQWSKPMLLIQRASYAGALPGFDAESARLDLQQAIALAGAVGMRR